jgi:uncharacterized protein
VQPVCHSFKGTVVKKILLVLFVLSMFLRPALAQNVPPSEASLKELMKITNISSLMDASMKQIEAMMRADGEKLTKGHTFTPEQKQILDDMYSQMTAVVTSGMSWEKLEPTMIDLYRQVYTQKEVDGMLAFYKTDAGRALIQKMPALMQATMQLMQRNIASTMPKMAQIRQDTLAKLRATGYAPAQ